MMTIGPAHALAQLAATLAFADDGALPSRVLLYADAALATGGTPFDAPLAEVALAKPCGTITDGVLTLHPAAPGGSMVLINGTPRAAHWVSGAGVLVAAGTVTDTDHDGDFSVGGAPTAPGDNAPSLYAGGLVLLGTVTLL